MSPQESQEDLFREVDHTDDTRPSASKGENQQLISDELPSSSSLQQQQQQKSQQSLMTPNDDYPLPQHVRPPNPLQHASIWSKLTFSWAYQPLLAVGSKRPLEEIDLPELDPVDTSHYQRQKLQQLWQQQQQQQSKNDHTSLAKALLKDYFRSTWLAQVLLVIQMVSRIGQAVALGYLLQTFDRRISASGFFWAGVLTICGAISFPAKQLQFFETYRKGMQTRVGLVAAVYAKTLRLPSTLGGQSDNHSTTTTTTNINDSKTSNKKNVSSSASSSSSGQITNLASNDVERFLVTSVSSIYLIYGPLEAIAIVLVGVYTVGSSFAAGLVFLVAVLLPLQFYLSRKFVRLRSAVAAKTDARVGWTAQALTGARTVKLNGWELQLQQRIQKLRNEEIHYIQSSTRYKAFNEATYFVASLTISVVIFLVDVFVAGNELSARKVFTTVSLNNILQMTLARLIPNAIMGLSECHVSCRRIQNFLQQPELQEVQERMNRSSSGSSDVPTNGFVLSLDNVTSYWESSKDVCIDRADQNNRSVAVKDVTLQFLPGTLYTVIGKIGSGKSALLSTLAGEMTIGHGSIDRNYSSLSYAEQEPWIMNGTIRENIVMGEKFEQSRYDKIIFACGLEPDLQSFAFGDETIVGERGVQCSGGQKSRISLARIIYKDAQVVLLDDPLSAVDAKVAQHIFRYAIQELCVYRQKCVIMVTHQQAFMEPRSRCILMSDGMCQSFESYQALSAEHPETHMEIPSRQSCVEENLPKLFSAEVNLEITKSDLNEESDHAKSQESELVANIETKNTGLIRWSTWVAYFAAIGGWPVLIVFISIFVATQSALLLTIVEIGKWSEVDPQEQTSLNWLWKILGFTASVVSLSFLRAMISFFILVQASNRLHLQLLKAVMLAKIEFFDCNPIGRILNRFAADTGICDEILPLTMFDFLVGFFIAMGSLVTAVVVLPHVLVALPFLLWRFWKLRQLFVKTTRELKRLEGISRSPCFALLSESKDGISTIRSNGFIQYCSKKFESFHDAHTRAFFSFVAASRWFAFKMDGIAFCLVAITSLLAVLLRSEGWFSIDPVLLGLALSLLLQLAGTNFPWMIRQSAEIVNQMISVERLLEYAAAPQELPLFSPFDEDHRDWPIKPSVSFNDVSVRYRRNLPRVLSNVSFSVAPSTKIGVVGRSGSGKSTLVQSLFRLLNTDEGNIEIDGLDISNFGLHKLRHSMSVIPQQPFLFSHCTIRKNLDPFGNHNDSAILKALGSVQMLDAVTTTLPNGLDAIVAEGGSNFSVGQRQLLCLARAILRKTKILVLDEATANVDLATSNLIYQAIDKEFEQATIISVAHRLEAVITYDQILVLGNGQLLEYGQPKELLAIPGGHFVSMVTAQGITF
ncbi:multidrug ABC transporter permease/ATPase [Nitzschia inconspicua]|uniref:Multidrug ABC transporter permease/ATPase n=1 Tax=Nitzschia inconspicua TaxID=303405 RepID=A0A9K3LE01_9STRA|nr:multidrug ABC transporter permease/ATPase [Nitzschia inconspicua]